MSDNYDAIVIGAGHNGLTNAAYLAKSGLRVLVLEQRDLVGGAAITEELRPGFKFTTFSYALSLLRPEIISELDLVRHGFMPLYMRSHFAPMDDGNYLLLGPDHEVNRREIARHSKHDADAYDRFEHDTTRVRQFVRPMFDSIPPNLFSSDPEDADRMKWLLKHWSGVDKKVLHDTVRLLTGSMLDFVDDYYESDILKATIVSAACVGVKLGPMSPGSGLNWLYLAMGEHDGSMGSWSFHKGGNGGFTQVLARAAQAYGADIRLNSRVAKLLTRDGEAVGVVLDDGTELRASTIVSSLDPRRTFLQIADARELPTDLVDAIERYRFQGITSKVNFALDGIPHYPALGDRTDQYLGFINVAPSVEYMERAYDTAKYGWYSEHPYIDASIQSFIDPDMAPPGKHVMSCYVMYTPYELKGSTWDVERDNMADRVQATMQRFFPNFNDLILQREVVSPDIIEAKTGLSEGNIYAGEFFPSQMYFSRPAPGYRDSRTPIHGYYQCGSGTHPGGCVIGAPGRFASQQIVKDLKR